MRISSIQTRALCLETRSHVVHATWWTAVVLVALLIVAATPVRAKVTVRGELLKEGTSVPGGSYRGEIVLSNSGTEAETVRLYLRDYSFRSDGTTDYGPPATLERSNAPWIQLPTDQVVIPPGAVTGVPFTVRVPQGQELSGTYWSILMIEPVAPDTPVKQRGFQVTTRLRYGVQMVTNIGDSGSRQLNFMGVKVQRDDDGTASLSVDVSNDGERGLRPELWVELFDGEGHSMGRFPAEKRGIYPGCSVRYRAPLAGVAPGAYRALVVADAGGDSLYGVELALELR